MSNRLFRKNANTNSTFGMSDEQKSKIDLKNSRIMGKIPRQVAKEIELKKRGVIVSIDHGKKVANG